MVARTLPGKNGRKIGAKCPYQPIFTWTRILSFAHRVGHEGAPLHIFANFEQRNQTRLEKKDLRGARPEKGFCFVFPSAGAPNCLQLRKGGLFSPKSVSFDDGKSIARSLSREGCCPEKAQNVGNSIRKARKNFRLLRSSMDGGLGGGNRGNIFPKESSRP